MLVLSAVLKKGKLARFDVVRAEETHVISDAVAGLPAGEYKILSDSNRVLDLTTEYRTVQDIEVDGNTTTIPA
jgi:hypothetical protein